MKVKDGEKDWVFVSDAHINGREPEETDAFIGFLDQEKERLSHLVILGDLFEFFFGFGGSYPEGSPSSSRRSCQAQYLPVWEKLQELEHLGVRIVYFEGNHDFFLAPFFRRHLGMDVEVYPDGGEIRLGGKRAFLAHGDLSNPRQWEYRLLRRLMKNRLAFGLIDWAGPAIAMGIARRWNERSYRRFHQTPQESAPPAFRIYAHEKFLEGYEVVILAHSHFPESAEEWIGPQKHLYFNVGDWMIHRSFLRFSPPDTFHLTNARSRGGTPGMREGNPADRG